MGTKLPQELLQEGDKNIITVPKEKTANEAKATFEEIIGEFSKLSQGTM